MVGGDVGGGYQNGGLGDGSQLGDGGRSGPAQHHIGSSHDQRHIINILPELHSVVPQLQPPAEQLLLHPGKIPASAVDVAVGRPLIALLGDEVRHAAVHGLRPQRAPVGQEQGPVIGEAQLLPGLLPGIMEEVPPHWSARDHHLLRVVVVGPALLKAHHDTIHHLGQGLGGQTRDGVGLVDRRGDMPPGGLLHHRERGVSPRPHHQVGAELIHDPPGLLLGCIHIPQGAQIVGDVRRGQGAVEVGNPHRLDGVALLGHQAGLHAAVSPHKEDPAARLPLLEDPGQRHRGIHMSRGPAAGK